MPRITSTVLGEPVVRMLWVMPLALSLRMTRERSDRWSGLLDVGLSESGPTGSITRPHRRNSLRLRALEGPVLAVVDAKGAAGVLKGVVAAAVAAVRRPRLHVPEPGSPGDASLRQLIKVGARTAPRIKLRCPAKGLQVRVDLLLTAFDPLPKFPKGMALDLTDAFPGQAELAPDILEGSLILSIQPKALLENAEFPAIQFLQQVVHHFVATVFVDFFKGSGGIFIFDDISQTVVVVVSDGCIE
jgi:hypothetical protein